MVRKIDSPSIIKAAGTKHKLIEEFFGLINSGDSNISIARMTSPGGWSEPGQTPDFDEYSLVLNGMLRVTTKEGITDVPEGSAVFAKAGEWVQYSTPLEEGANYIAICLPAFSPASVHRDKETDK